MSRTDKKLTKGEKALIAWVSVFVALVLAGVWWWTDINAMPEITFPTRSLPEPNAQEYFVRAASMGVDKQIVTDAFLAWHRRSNYCVKFPPKAKITTALQRNAPVLAELRRGFAFPYGVSDPQGASGETTALFYDLRYLARLLMLNAHIEAEKGHWPVVAQCSLVQICV